MNKELKENIRMVKELLNNPDLEEKEKELLKERLKVLEEIKS
jgi:hypothetical protein